jgi:uncharacterized lipoprotein YajG
MPFFVAPEDDSHFGREVIMKAKSYCILAILIAAFLLCGCTTVYRPTYIPEAIFYEDLSEMPVRLQVHDDRKEKDKIFYKNWPILISESTASFRLEPSSRAIIERSLKKAMSSSGYLLKEDAPVIIDVNVREFIWCYNHYALAFGQSLSADIKLEVMVKKQDRILLRKVIAERVERSPPITNLGKDKDEEMLSECLTKVVEKLISDHNIIAAIKRCYEINTVLNRQALGSDVCWYWRKICYLATQTQSIVD